MARQSYPSNPRSAGSRYEPVPPLFSPASQRHPSTDRAENQLPPIANSLSASDPRSRNPKAGAGLPPSPSKSPMLPVLPSLPKHDTVATVPNGLNQVGPTQGMKATSGVTSPGISTLDTSGQQNQQLQERAIADLQQTLDMPLEASIFEAALLEQLEDSPAQPLDPGVIKA
ncbi:MAG: hypothetical protein F6K30_31195, partial [Cyanothece sp. SIO2G6]|nr:hypothetical protein [Cyanothece sp. SIO2G6]